jgi:transcription initiation factor IIF auxiliary subunit
LIPSKKAGKMNLMLKNRWHYRGGDWWEWEAFLDDEGSGDLAKVDFVEYVLHETFPNPVRRIDDPEGGFVLRTAGWGIFELKAFVYTKDGDKVKLTHQIALSRRPEVGVSG